MISNYAVPMIIMFSFMFCREIRAQKVIISGYIKDAGSKEALINANIYEGKLQQGTTSNQYGFYSLTLPASDTFNIIVSYVGYKPEVKKMITNTNVRMDVLLEPSLMLNELEITAARNDDNVNEAQMGVMDVPVQEIKRLPVLMGERDLLKVIQLLPGVQQAQEGTTGFFVRGGNLDQNLIQLDEATVYNPNHLFGLLSTFNINAINSVQIIKGGFPAQYGGGLSSILNIIMKDGNKEKYEVEGGLGILSSNITLQGPLIHNKASIIVSARRSYLDLIQKAFIPNNTTLYSFFDVNEKVNIELGRNDKIYLSAFKGRDNGSYTGTNSLNYDLGFGNSTATVRWNHLFGANLFANTSLIFNAYDLGLSNSQGNYYSLFYTGIKDTNGKTDFTWYTNPNHMFKFGGSYFYHTSFPATFSDQIPGSGNRVKLDPDKIPKRHSHEYAVYVNHEWRISSNIAVHYGLRVPYYVGKHKTYTRWEPRATVKVSLNNTTAAKISYTVMNQFVHAVPYSSASFPTDIWIASDELVKPQNSQQYSVGIFKNLHENQYEVSLELYYKDMKNQVLFKQGTQLNVESDLEQELTFGKGISKGIEFFVRKNTGKLSGWLSYTLSKTTQTFAELNYGKPFPFTYDRRHNLSIVGNYKLNERWSVSADFVFRTGSALTMPAGRIPVSDGTLYDGWYYDYTTRNNSRLKSYHRLDVSFSYKKQRTILGRKYDSEWVFGAYNIYSRRNPYFVYVTVNAEQVPQAKQVSLLPIVPSVSYNFKF